MHWVRLCADPRARTATKQWRPRPFELRGFQRKRGKSPSNRHRPQMGGIAGISTRQHQQYPVPPPPPCQPLVIMASLELKGLGCHCDTVACRLVPFGDFLVLVLFSTAFYCRQKGATKFGNMWSQLPLMTAMRAKKNCGKLDKLRVRLECWIQVRIASSYIPNLSTSTSNQHQPTISFVAYINPIICRMYPQVLADWPFLGLMPHFKTIHHKGWTGHSHFDHLGSALPLQCLPGRSRFPPMAMPLCSVGKACQCRFWQVCTLNFDNSLVGFMLLEVCQECDFDDHSTF